MPNIIPLKVAKQRTRGAESRLVLTELSRSSLGQFSIGCRGASTWNALPRDVRGFNGSFGIFKQKLKAVFLAQISSIIMTSY